MKRFLLKDISYLEVIQVGELLIERNEKNENEG